MASTSTENRTPDHFVEIASPGTRAPIFETTGLTSIHRALHEMPLLPQTRHQWPGRIFFFGPLPRPLSALSLFPTNRRHRHSDFVGTVLLDEMDPVDRDFGLVRPPAAKLTLAAGQDRARFSVDK